MTDKNHLDFTGNEPYNGIHTPFSLEGHFQPWYDDRRDYNTNAPTYYDYLSNFNGLVKEIVNFVNELAKRDLKVEDTKTVELIKKTSWLVDGVNDIIIKANAKVSQVEGNNITIKDDGLYVETPDLETLKAKVDTLEQNLRALQLTVTQNHQSTIAWITSHNEAFNALKNRVDLLDGGGWATKEQLEELRSIITANREDYENADSGLRLLITNMQKRLDALDGLQGEVDTWNEKVKVLEAEQLNVKNIATATQTLVGAMSTYGYTSSAVNTSQVIDKKDRFVVLYNSFTQRINGRITRIERLGFDFSGITTAGKAIDPVNWTHLGEFTTARVETDYKGSWSNNIKNQIHRYAFRYYQQYFTYPVDGLMYPWSFRLDYGADGIFSIWSRGLKSIATKGDIVKPVTEEVYTVVTWLDDEGNEYLPKYKANGDPEELSNCERVTPYVITSSEEQTADDSGIRVVEYEGKKYFSDELNDGNTQHPLDH